MNRRLAWVTLVGRMYFHVSGIDHLPGDIIEPGQWGRTVRQFRPGGPMPSPNFIASVLWEVALETSRIATDPELPSRLDCVFVCDTLEMAVAFRDRYRSGANIFEVAPLEGSAARQYRGDFSLISSGSHRRAYADYMAEDAAKYWTAQTEHMPEVLYAGPLRVIGRVQLNQEETMVCTETQAG